MAKIKVVKPSVRTVAPMLRRAPVDEADRSRFRDQTQAWRAWYKTARWQKLRMSILVRDRFTCQMCWLLEPNSSQLVCDHVTPHRGDEELFWSGPFQTLCKPCHDRDKQRMERRTCVRD
ncbi:HNH endonuclease [Phyllobacterium phragmitis]|uniref:HNH endonuclease n=1 Tax=Phyllobacterium phragmitis TaxID=2670329 RepID=A0A2S9INR0_9HYPH|nr:HNH endonuclease [Phyllobacterium phragmitis]